MCPTVHKAVSTRASVVPLPPIQAYFQDLQEVRGERKKRAKGTQGEKKQTRREGRHGELNKHCHLFKKNKMLHTCTLNKKKKQLTYTHTGQRGRWSSKIVLLWHEGGCPI